MAEYTISSFQLWLVASIIIGAFVIIMFIAFLRSDYVKRFREMRKGKKEFKSDTQKYNEKVERMATARAARADKKVKEEKPKEYDALELTEKEERQQGDPYRYWKRGKIKV